MAHELVEPTGALDELFDRSVQPQIARLHSIIREFLPGGTPQNEVELHASSIVGQILLYHFARPVVKKIQPTKPGLETIATHITEWSLRALERSP